jgi:hypothetical protein
MQNTFYCLQCDADCGPFEHCCACEDNPEMQNVAHPGFASSAEIQQEIDAEDFWYEYD